MKLDAQRFTQLLLMEALKNRRGSPQHFTVQSAIFTTAIHRPGCFPLIHPLVRARHAVDLEERLVLIMDW
jgi:hypothetical protein